MTPPEITIRRICPEDKAHIRTIIRRAFSLPIWPFFSLSDDVFVADRDGCLIGGIVLEMLPLPGGRKGGEVAWIFTDPDARGLGAGQALVEAGLSYLEAEGCDEMLAIVEGNNSSSAKLFANRGFSILSPGEQFRRYGWRVFLVWLRLMHFSDVGHFLWARPPERDADRPVFQWWGALLLNVLFVGLALWRRQGLGSVDLGRAGEGFGLAELALAAVGVLFLLGARHVAMRNAAALRGLCVRYRVWESTFPTTFLVALIFGAFFPAPGGLYPRGHDWRYDDLVPKLGPMGLAGSLTVLLLVWGAWLLQRASELAPSVDRSLGIFVSLTVPLALLDTVFAFFPFTGFNGRRLWDWNRTVWFLLSAAAVAVLFV